MTVGAQIDSYVEPATLAEAAQALSMGPATLVAGGTLVVREAQAGRFSYAPTLINLHRVDEMRGIELTDAGLRIGALTRLRDINEHAVIRESAAVLAQTALHMASTQVRNLGTIGGNLCWASPSADLTVSFLVLDAVVELICASGGQTTTRSLPVNEFLTGSEQTARAANEILTAVTIPPSALGLRGGFMKSGTRIALDTTIASVGIAAAIENKVLRHVRIGLGGVAPTAIRAPRTEAVVEGQQPSVALLKNATAAVGGEIDPPSDARASAWYRRELIGVFTKRVLNGLANA